MRIWREVRNFASQKFRLTPVIRPPTLLQNVLFYLFLLTSVVQNVCVCTVDIVSASKNTYYYYYYMWPFAKKLYHGWISTMTSSNEISWKNEELVEPLTILECFIGVASLLAKKIRIHVFGKKRYVVHHVHQLLFRTSVFVLAKFSIAYA